LALYLYRFGVLIIGVFSGICFGAFIGVAFFMPIYPSHPEIPVIVTMCILGIGFGAFSYCQEKPIIIICTSWLGAYLLIFGIGNFIGNYPTPSNISDLFTQFHEYGNLHMPSIWWVYFAATLVVWVLYIVFQFKVSAWQVDHSKCDENETRRRPPRPPYIVSTAVSPFKTSPELVHV